MVNRWFTAKSWNDWGRSWTSYDAWKKGIFSLWLSSPQENVEMAIQQHQALVETVESLPNKSPEELGRLVIPPIVEGVVANRIIGVTKIHRQEIRPMIPQMVQQWQAKAMKGGFSIIYYRNKGGKPYFGQADHIKPTPEDSYAARYDLDAKSDLLDVPFIVPNVWIPGTSFDLPSAIEQLLINLNGGQKGGLLFNTDAAPGFGQSRAAKYKAEYLKEQGDALKYAKDWMDNNQPGWEKKYKVP